MGKYYSSLFLYFIGEFSQANKQITKIIENIPEVWYLSTLG